MFDPQTHTDRGIAFETVINGLQKARLDAKEKWGINSLFIMSYLRHLSEESAFETLKQSLPYKDLITSIGLDSSEMGNPPTKFKNVFEASVKEGYIPVAHAGEKVRLNIFGKLLIFSKLQESITEIDAWKTKNWFRKS
jgi:adenosine deaminase